MGPTIYVKTLDYENFLFFWVEWINVAGLGTGAILPAASAADFHLGNYPTADGVFLNPASVLTDGGAAWT